MDYYSTGAVSKKLNITVRTLRYYDQIGLLTPSHKDQSGKRLYNDEDLLTLEKITLLKLLHLPLKDIEKILSKITIEQLLQTHKDSLEKKNADLTSSVKLTNTLMNVLRVEGNLNWEQLIPLVREAQNRGNVEQHWEEYFDEQEKETLKATLPKMEDDGLQVKQWINITRRVEICLEKGIPPESEEGKLIIEDALLLSQQMFAGNDELADKFFEIRKSKEKSRELNLYPVKEEVLAFLEEGMRFLWDRNS